MEISDSSLADRLATPKTRHLLAVRNPYLRLASFFADKLRQDLQRRSGEWQYCQRIFFSFVGVAEHDSFSTIRTALLGISFEDFIDYLPLVQEDHLTPQCTLLKAAGRDLEAVTEIFRIETHAGEFWQNVGVKAPPHANKTSSQPDPFGLARGRLDIVNRIYSGDFSQLGYAMV